MAESDGDDDFLIGTGIENGESFREACKGSVDEFLKRDEYIPVRGTVVSEEELEFLEVENDIDGVTIRWKDISKGLSLGYTHINLAPRNVLDIKPVYSIIKTHLDLREYGNLGLLNLKQAVGFEVIYFGGWTTLLCFLPKTSFKERCNLNMYKEMALANMNQLRHEFQLQLIQLNVKGQALNTLAKNNIFNPLKLFVLPGDRRIILSTLQSSLEQTELVATGFTKTFFSYRFGEKCTTTLTLPILDESGVEDICVHVGVKIRSEFHDLFWCREGVNSVIGKRGIMTSCCSFFECVNFQSNLDERGLDVKPELLAISSLPGEVRFVQLYADIPHRQLST